MQLSTTLGYAPAPTDSFTILTGGPVTGQFAGGTQFNAGTFNGLFYVGRITYTPTSVVLSDIRPTAVPEPATWLLAGGPAVAWVVRRKWRKQSLAE